MRFYLFELESLSSIFNHQQWHPRVVQLFLNRHEGLQKVHEILQLYSSVSSKFIFYSSYLPKVIIAFLVLIYRRLSFIVLIYRRLSSLLQFLFTEGYHSFFSSCLAKVIVYSSCLSKVIVYSSCLAKVIVYSSCLAKVIFFLFIEGRCYARL